jgi:probable rRNA maturation factor
MTRVNQAWRGKAYATDILSFPAPEFFQKQGLLGELVLCWSTLEKQAKSFHHSAKTELDILLVHGVLHLLGLDHEQSARELRKQASLETLLLSHLGTRAKSGLIERVQESR